LKHSYKKILVSLVFQAAKSIINSPVSHSSNWARQSRWWPSHNW
jgi:hypothetical protein